MANICTSFDTWNIVFVENDGAAALLLRRHMNFSRILAWVRSVSPRPTLVGQAGLETDEVRLEWYNVHCELLW